jgi:multicomponent Na+:H+ antiporter subunit F
MGVVFAVTFGLIAVAGLLTLARLMRGPSALDRIVALDGIAVLVVSGVAVEAARTGENVNAALMVTIVLLGFVASVTTARFVEGREL